MGEFRNVCNFIIIKGAGTYPWVSGLGRGTPGGESGIWRLAHSLTQAYLGLKGLMCINNLCCSCLNHQNIAKRKREFWNFNLDMILNWFSQVTNIIEKLLSNSKSVDELDAIILWTAFHDVPMVSVWLCSDH